MKSHKKTHPAVRTLYILLISMCTMFSINAQITHIPQRVSHTQVKNKKLYKYKAPLIDSVATRLKKLKTALWGNDSWQKNYLKRIITLSLCTLSTCIAQDIWAHNTNITHGKLENEKNQKIQESVRTNANNSESVSTLDSLLIIERSQGDSDLKEQLELSVPEKPTTPLDETPRASAVPTISDDEDLKTPEKENLELQGSLARGPETHLRVQQLVADLNTECEQTLEAENNTALEIQRKDDAFKARLDILLSLFAQAIIQNRPDDATKLLTEGEEDPSYIEISTAFARTVHQKFNIDKFTLNPDDHIKHIIRVTAEQMIYTENSTHNTIINFFKIALKLKNCHLAERCISAKRYIYSAEKQDSMISEAYKHQCYYIVGVLQEKFGKNHGAPLKSAAGRRYQVLMSVEELNRTSFDYGPTSTHWEYAVRENDHQAISLILSKIRSDSLNTKKPYIPIFNNNNLYALSSLLSKKQALANNDDIKDAANSTLLDIYLSNTCSHDRLQLLPRKACPLMVKLLINAGVQLKDVGRVPTVPSKYADINCSSFQQASLGRFMFFACKNPDPDRKRERVMQLLITERDKVKISNEEALYAASMMGMHDYVYDIIVTSKQCIHPSLLETFCLLTSSRTREVIENAHNRRTEIRKAQGYEDPEVGTTEDNNALLAALDMPAELMKIIWEYAKDAPSTSTHATPLPQNKEN